MITSRYIYQISKEEWEAGKEFMFSEIQFIRLRSEIRLLLFKAIADYESGKFSYDGATFVRERSKSLFEVAAFIHDWRNSMGYVSYAIDNEMIDVMITLQYRSELIFSRYILTRLTFINVIRHKLRKTFVASVPDNLYRLT